MMMFNQVIESVFFRANTDSESLRKRMRLLACLLILPAFVNAQEICDNGIDDDGDNLVDVFDPDCPCDDQVLLCQPSCEFVSPGGQLNFTSQWSSAETIPVYQTPLVGDIDNDDVPEVLFLSSNSLVSSDPRRARDILVINGASGVTELTISTPFVAWVGPTPYAIADIDGDGFGEIILAAMNHSDNDAASRGKLFCYEHTGALKWVSDSTFGSAATQRFGSSVGIADFNNDGIPEVHIYNRVFNAQTGVLLASGGNTGASGIMTNQAFGDVSNAVAADITSDPGLELAAGNTVYNVTITNTNGLTGNALIPITIPGFADGYTSVADIDLDGNLDVVVASQGNTGTLYVWNPGNGTPFLVASVSFPNTGGNWIGVPFIGDMDKDCQPEIGVTRSRRVYALDYNGSTTLANKWTLVTSDASGFTGITMFDFNQDGTQELVYRDESQLRIIDGSGSTPVTIGTNACGSGTGTEMPVVADVDGDGQAEICVSCSTIDIQLGRLQVFESAGQPWAACRSVWNQYSYFNVNINANLTVPIQQQQHQVLLSTVTCPFYNCSENRPFNTFLAQATFLTQEGCPIYPASNVALSAGATACNGSSQYQISLNITNVGGAPSDSGYPIRFYAGNPFNSAAIPLPVLIGPNSTSDALDPDEIETLNFTLDITEPEKPFTLFAILNDAGNLIPPFAFPLNSLPECDYTDNIIFISNIDCCPFGDLSIDDLIPPSAEFCEGGSQIFSIQASSSAGLSSSITTWTLPGNTQINADSITVSDAGTYTVTVEDNAHCTVSQNFQVNSIALPTPAAAGADQQLCEEQTILQANAPNVGTGLWSVIGGTATLSNPANPSSSLSNLQVGTVILAWTITNGVSCISSDTILITRVNPPDASDAGPDQQVCETEATLNANAPNIGIGTWSVVSGSGTFSNVNNPQATVSGLGQGINVFRWTISSGDCSPQFDEVTIERFAQPTGDFAGPDQSICSDATQLNAQGAGVWSLITGIANISDVNNNQATISNLIPGIYELQWTVTVGACPAVSDTMVISFVPPPSPAQAGPDLQVCAQEGNLSAIPPVSGFGSWTVISGSAIIASPGQPISQVSNLSVGQNTFVFTVSSLGVCPVSRDTVTFTRFEEPSQAIAGLDQSVCSNQATLSGNIPGVGSALWTIVSGDVLIQNPSSSSTSLVFNSPGTAVLQYTISNGVCPPSADELSITSSELPQNTDAGPDQTICEESTILGADIPSAGNGLWSILSGTATLVNPNDNQSGINIPGFETIELLWTVTNGACITSSQTSVTRVQPPSAAIAGIDQDLCATTAQLTANTPASGSGNWSVISGAANFNDAANPNTSVSGLATGINELVWTITSGNCPAEADTLTLNVSQDPLLPFAGIDQQICNGEAILEANPANIGTAEWTVISGSGNILDPTDPQSEVSGISVGSTLLRWTITNGACIAFDEVLITRSDLPSISEAGVDTAVCQGSELILYANTPLSGTGTWSSSNPEVIFDDQGNPLASVSGFQPGTYSLVWTISSGACPPSADSLLVSVSENNASANAGLDQTICADTITINALDPINGTVFWETTSGSAIIDNPTSQSVFISGLQPGINLFSLSVTNGACPPAVDEVQITVNALPDTSDAGNDQQVCGNNAVLDANVPASGTGLWSVITGNADFNNPGSPNAEVSNLGPGVNVLQWTITSGVCPPSSDQVIILSDSISLANAGNDLQTCNGAEIGLQALEPNPGIGVWTLLSGSGTFSDANNPISNFTPDQNGTSELLWTVTTGNCPPAFDTLLVQSIDLPGPAVAGNDTSLCSTLLILNAQVPQFGTGVWSSPQAVSFQNPNEASTTVESLQPGLTQLIWTVSNGICPPAADTLVLNVDKQPITPNAGSDLDICGFSTQLSAGVPPVGTGEWSVITGSANISDASNPNSELTNLLPGITILRWTITAGECIVFDEMQITASEPPSLADAGLDILVCGDSATLSGSEPVIGTGLWSLVSGNASFEDASNPLTAATGLNAGQNTFAWTITSGACKPSVDFVVVTRDTTIPPAAAGDDLNICSDTASLNAVPAPGGFWQIVSGTAILADSSLANTLVGGIQIGATVLQWTVPSAGSCPETIDLLTITRSAPPSEAILEEDMMICDSEVELIGNQPSVGTGSWIVVSGNAIVTDPNSATTNATGLEPGNNVFEWRITNGSCPPETEQITIARGDTAYAGPDQTVCDSSASLSASLPSGLTGFWSLVSGSGDFTDSLQAETQVLNLSEGENVFQWTILGGFCPDSVDSVIITVACNTPPVIINDTLSVFEDSVLTGSVFNGDFDPDSTALVVDTVLVQEPGNGTFVLNPDGSFTYTPDPDFFGNDTVIVQICDSGIPLPELCDNDTIYIIVLPVNDPPVLVNDEVSTSPGQSISGNLNDNNSDPEGDPLVVNTNPVSGPGNGTITLNPDGSYTYTPDEGFTGSDTVVIEICDDPIPGTDSICGLDTLIIVVELQELFADAGIDTTICGNTITLNANTPSAGTGQWSVIEGNATISNSSSPNAQALNLSPGENTFVWTVTENNQSASDTVTITVIDVAPAFAGEDQIICGEQTTLSGSDPENGIVQWTIFEGSGVITNSNNQNAIVNGLQPGEAVISYTISLGDCFASDTLLIQVLPEASVALQADTSICPRVTSIQIAGQASPANGSWTVVTGNAVFDNNSVSATASQFSAGENVLVYNTGQSPCAASDTLVITVLSENDLACAGIFIPEGFSPNEDGSNDNFVIFGTENLDVTLKVFNRWGNLVYENNNYQNNWDGTCNQGGVLYGEKLPAGTYYYLVQIQGESGTRKGYLTLWR